MAGETFEDPTKQNTTTSVPKERPDSSGIYSKKTHPILDKDKTFQLTPREEQIRSSLSSMMRDQRNKMNVPSAIGGPPRGESLSQFNKKFALLRKRVSPESGSVPIMEDNSHEARQLRALKRLEKTANTNTMLEERMAEQRHAALVYAMDRQGKNLTNLHAFQMGPMVSYMAKDLALGTKQASLLEGQSRTLRMMAQVMEQKLEAIKLNTSAPSIRKQTKVDVIKDMAFRQSVAKVLDTVIDPMTKPIRDKIRSTVVDPVSNYLTKIVNNPGGVRQIPQEVLKTLPRPVQARLLKANRYLDKKTAPLRTAVADRYVSTRDDFLDFYDRLGDDRSKKLETAYRLARRKLNPGINRVKEIPHDVFERLSPEAQEKLRRSYRIGKINAKKAKRGTAKAIRSGADRYNEFIDDRGWKLPHVDLDAIQDKGHHTLNSLRQLKDKDHRQQLLENQLKKLEKLKSSEGRAEVRKQITDQISEVKKQLTDHVAEKKKVYRERLQQFRDSGKLGDFAQSLNEDELEQIHSDDAPPPDVAKAIQAKYRKHLEQLKQSKLGTNLRQKYKDARRQLAESGPSGMLPNFSALMGNTAKSSKTSGAMPEISGLGFSNLSYSDAILQAANDPKAASKLKQLQQMIPGNIQDQLIAGRDRAIQAAASTGTAVRTKVLPKAKTGAKIAAKVALRQYGLDGLIKFDGDQQQAGLFSSGDGPTNLFSEELVRIRETLDGWRGEYLTRSSQELDLLTKISQGSIGGGTPGTGDSEADPAAPQSRWDRIKAGLGGAGAWAAKAPFRAGLWGAKKTYQAYKGMLGLGWGGTKLAAKGAMRLVSGGPGDPIRDVYRKDKLGFGQALITKSQLRRGVFFADGSQVRSIDQIDQPVFDSLTGQELITQEDLQAGLVDFFGRPLTSGGHSILGSGLTALGAIGKGGLNLASSLLGLYGKAIPAMGGVVKKGIGALAGVTKAGLKVGGPVVNTLLKGGFGLGGQMFGLYGKLLTGALGFGGRAVGGLAKGIFGGKKDGLGDLTKKDVYELISKRLDDIYDILDLRLGKSGKVDDDSDGDGVRDGSYQDQMKKLSERRKAKREILDEATGSKVGIKGKFSAMLAAMGLAGKKAKKEDDAEDEESGGGGFLQSIFEAYIASKIPGFKSIKNGIKGFGGKVLGGMGRLGSGALGAAKSLVGLGGASAAIPAATAAAGGLFSPLRRYATSAIAGASMMSPFVREAVANKLGNAGRFALDHAGSLRAPLMGAAAGAGMMAPLLKEQLLAKAGAASSAIGKAGAHLLPEGVKAGLKVAGKSALKKIPGIGLIAGLGFGANRAVAGDWTGAAGEIASGAVSLVPVFGTAASIGIDSWLAYRDISKATGAMANLLNARFTVYGVKTKTNSGVIGELERAAYAVLEKTGPKLTEDIVRGYTKNLGFDVSDPRTTKYINTWMNRRFLPAFTIYHALCRKYGVTPESIGNLPEKDMNALVNDFTGQTQKIVTENEGKLEPEVQTFKFLLGEVTAPAGQDKSVEKKNTQPDGKNSQPADAKDALKAANENKSPAVGQGVTTGETVAGAQVVAPTKPDISAVPKVSASAYGGLFTSQASAEAIERGPKIVGPGQVAMPGLGSMSAKYESGKKGSDAIGYDSTGGTSYGKYQIASNTGTYDQFLKFAASQGANGQEVARQLMAAGAANTGSTNGAVPEVWKKLVADGKMGDLEHQFIKSTHYDAALSKLPQDVQDKINSSPALQQVLWSTAVQHGAGGAASIFKKSYDPSLDTKAFVRQIYTNRGDKFGSSSDNVRASVLNRFVDESKTALAMVDSESSNDNTQVAKADTSPVTGNPVIASNSGLPTLRRQNGAMASGNGGMPVSGSQRDAIQQQNAPSIEAAVQTEQVALAKKNPPPPPPAAAPVINVPAQPDNSKLIESQNTVLAELRDTIKQLAEQQNTPQADKGQNTFVQNNVAPQPQQQKTDSDTTISFDKNRRDRYVG